VLDDQLVDDAVLAHEERQRRVARLFFGYEPAC